VAFVDAVEGLVERGPAVHSPESRWLIILRPILALGRTRFFLLRVRLKLSLELGRLGRGARARDNVDPKGENLDGRD
jgi:hypothetical protein